MSRDKRTARRIPIACPATLSTLDLGPSYEGTCVDLSVGGLTIHSNFVPRPGEELEVTVLPPTTGNLTPKPMVVRARVRRCHEIDAGLFYEIGLEIIKVLS